MTKRPEGVRLIAAVAPLFTRRQLELHMPRGLFIVAEVLQRQGFEVEVLDCQLEDEDLTRYDVAGMADAILEGPRIVGISSMCDNLPLVVAACERAKAQAPDKVICLGGPGPSFVAEALMERFSSIDLVVVGEGEETAAELFPLLTRPQWREELCRVRGIVYRDTNGQVVRTERRPLLDLGRDTVLPAYGLADTTAYAKVGILTARGCPFGCTFCSTRVFWTPRVRYRLVADVMAEIKSLVRMGFGSNGTTISFDDDLFPTSAARVEKICQSIMDESLEFPWNCMVRVDTVSPRLLATMRQAGFIAAALGIETGSDKVLREVRKGFTVREAMRALEVVREYAKAVRTFFIWGFPFETPADLMQTLIATHRVGSSAREEDCIVIGMASPLPGSKLHADRKDALFFDRDVYFAYGGVGSSGFLRNRRIRDQLVDMIRENPELFSPFYCFEQPALEEKLRMLSTARVFENFYEGVPGADGE